MLIRLSRIHSIWIVIGLGGVLAACSAPPLSDQDRIATRVAEDRAVAATLTASAPTLPPPPASNLPPATSSPPSPTSTALPSATVTPTTAPLATATPRQAGSIVPPATHTPTPQPTLVAIVPGFGTPKGLRGQIMLPGYSGPLAPPVFRDAIVFRLMVRDPAFGDVDGAGIQVVNMSIDSSHGQVHSRAEQHAAYCVFGNPTDSPECDIWRFSEHKNQWPNGTPVCAGQYQGNMTVETQDPAKNGAFWGFNFEIAGDYPPC